MTATFIADLAALVLGAAGLGLMVDVFYQLDMDRFRDPPVRIQLADWWWRP